MCSSTTGTCARQSCSAPEEAYNSARGGSGGTPLQSPGASPARKSKKSGKEAPARNAVSPIGFEDWIATEYDNRDILRRFQAGEAPA